VHNSLFFVPSESEIKVRNGLPREGNYLYLSIYLSNTKTDEVRKKQQFFIQLKSIERNGTIHDINKC
jgi:hypothetical protein